MKYLSAERGFLWLWSLPTRGAWIEMTGPLTNCFRICASLPTRGAWIEIANSTTGTTHHTSLPTRGAWIEIPPPPASPPITSSLPTRGAWIEIAGHGPGGHDGGGRSPHGERGLKLVIQGCHVLGVRRSPHGERGLKSPETSTSRMRERRSPHGERGLKYVGQLLVQLGFPVAPHTGSVD